MKKKELHITIPFPIPGPDVYFTPRQTSETSSGFIYGTKIITITKTAKKRIMYYTFQSEKPYLNFTVEVVIGVTEKGNKYEYSVEIKA